MASVPVPFPSPFQPPGTGSFLSAAMDKKDSRLSRRIARFYLDVAKGHAVTFLVVVLALLVAAIIRSLSE